jgi:nucleoid DNA-binding protein
MARICMSKIAKAIAKDKGILYADVKEILEDFTDGIKEALKKGDMVEFTGLGVLEPRWLPPRWGKNPKTGETIPVRGQIQIYWRTARRTFRKELDEAYEQHPESPEADQQE